MRLENLDEGALDGLRVPRVALQDRRLQVRLTDDVQLRPVAPDHLPGDPGGAVADQEHHQRRDPIRRPIRRALPLRPLRGPDHSGVRQRAHGVDPDPHRLEIQRP